MNRYALELNQVRKRFGNTEIIRGVNLQIEKGERLAIIGPNGAGKSTLFNLISGRFAQPHRVLRVAPVPKTPADRFHHKA